MAYHKRDFKREAFWRRVLARHRRSGLDVRAFCRQHKLAESAFYFWRRTVARRDAEAGSGTKSTKRPVKRRRKAPAFLPVVMRDHLGLSSGMSIELRGGRVLRLGEATPVERLVAIVRALEAAEVWS